jgi:phage shock protein A
MRKATQRGWKVAQDCECKEIIKQAEAALASQPSDLRAKLEALRDKVANGIVSSQMREISGDYDSGATDVEIAVEAALTAIIEGKD